MEQGNLTGSIPTEVAALTNLIFIDLDFNQITGTLEPFLGLSSLTQLDLNDNRFTGSIDGVFKGNKSLPRTSRMIKRQRPP